MKKVQNCQIAKMSYCLHQNSLTSDGCFDNMLNLGYEKNTKNHKKGAA
ncbi:MAG: hypothetical protein GY858_06985 [Candidatus Omnitrophica bacterium]|nr:hypothetical protein [Candidatus Omnitrophota bacterium]